jgi:hypothetical protein
VKSLISSLAKEMNLDQIDIERVYEAPFALFAIVMRFRCDREKKHFPSLRIPYFGIFYCPPWNKARLTKIEERIKNKKDAVV